MVMLQMTNLAQMLCTTNLHQFPHSETHRTPTWPRMAERAAPKTALASNTAPFVGHKYVGTPKSFNLVHFHPIIQNHPISSVDMALSQDHPNPRALTPILPIQLARMVASALFLNTCTCHDHQNKRVIHLLILKGPICVLFGSYSYPNPHLSWNSPAGSQPSRPCPCWWGALQIPRWLRCWWVPIASWNASAILSLALGTSKQGDL